MFVRNGIKSNLLERCRTALFSLLIVSLTVTLLLAISVLLYCRAVMDACDKACRSIAPVEYMGTEYPVNGLVIFRVEPFTDADDLPYAECAEGAEIPERFLRASEQYRAMNNYVRVVPCRNVNDVYAFHQNDLRLAEGAMPDPGTPDACIVSADLAEGLGLAPGGAFSLAELRGTAEDRYDLTPTGETQVFTVSALPTRLSTSAAPSGSLQRTRTRRSSAICWVPPRFATRRGERE